MQAALPEADLRVLPADVPPAHPHSQVPSLLRRGSGAAPDQPGGHTVYLGEDT